MDDLLTRKVVFLCEDYRIPGGIERVNATWTEILNSRNIPSELADEHAMGCFFPVGPNTDFSKFELLPEVGIKRHPISLFLKLKNAYRWIKTRSGQDLIIQRSYQLPIFALLSWAARRRNIRLFYFSHTSLKDFLKNYSRFDLQFFLRRYDRVLCLYKNADIPEAWKDRIAFLQNPSPLLLTERSETSSKQVLYLGRLSAEKRPLFLIEAWDLLMNRYPDLKQWTLEIAGDGPLYSDVKREISRRGLLNVRLVGATPEVAPLLLNASILVMTSLFEGMPMAIIEAKMAGMCPVSTENDGARYLIKDGVDGLISKNEMSDFCQKLALAMQNSEFRKKIADESYRSRNAFSWETSLQQLQKIRGAK